MVKEQFFFDPEFEIEDEPEGEEGGEALPVAGDQEQARSGQKKAGVHGMPDIAVRAMGNENCSAPDGWPDIEMTQAHDLDGPAGQQQGGDEKRQGQQVKLVPPCRCRQKEKQNELTGNKKSPVFLVSVVLFL